MNESDTRLNKIDPALKVVGWSVVPESRITTEYVISKGMVGQTHGRKKVMKADYVLIYNNVKLAIVEAKSDEKDVSEGVMQAKEYANRLNIRFTYATNGDKIREIDMKLGVEREVDKFASPEELWNRTYTVADEWRDNLNKQAFYYDGSRKLRYYQEVAIKKVLEGIAEGKKRMLLTLATGTGKTLIASQIAYKLFESKWNVRKTYNRPRILFLTDRNGLADQAYNAFSGAFKTDAMVRIMPDIINKNNGKVPTNGSIFFTIFQTLSTVREEKLVYEQYTKDFFDLVIIDECHRGGANDESKWRDIMNYFEDAVQLGLTATPRRDVNANTYKYFGDPIYEYSLRQGIEDGYLTPFRHIAMRSTIDEYVYDESDDVISGEVDAGKVYTEQDFYNGNIRIKERDMARVKEFMSMIGPDEKTLVFCAKQSHAGQVRDMINEVHHGNPMYCVRVTANDGAIGDSYLKEFQDNEKLIPTVLTTSQKLSTGVDALNVRNIVLMRPINSMIEFKQIIGRGTRLYDGKKHFTVYDFVQAYQKYQDPQWDGEPVCSKCGQYPCVCKVGSSSGGNNGGGGVGEDDWVCPRCGQNPCICPKPEQLEITLSDGRKRNIRFETVEMFFGVDGQVISAKQFLEDLLGILPSFFSSESDLRSQWANPDSRKILLDKMNASGYGKDILKKLRRMIHAENSDLLDVLEFVAYSTTPMERAERAEKVKQYAEALKEKQKKFVEVVMRAYVKDGIEELERGKLPSLLEMAFGSVPEGVRAMGGIDESLATFNELQKILYL